MTGQPTTTTMLAAVFYGGKDIRVEERPIPQPRSDEVLVRVRSAGICGADLLGYNGIGPWQPPMGVGIEEGHELAGEIAAIGDEVHGLSAGQHVAVQPEHLIACGSCHQCTTGKPHLCSHLGMLRGAPHNSHGFSQYDAVLASHVRPIPDSLSIDAASIADCFGVGVHAVHRAGGVEGQVVAIIGCGTIGMCVGQSAHALGASRVVMIGDLPDALDVARRTHAADEVVLVPKEDPSPLLAGLTSGVGPSVVFEAVGRAGTTLEQALKLVSPGGKVCIVGTFTSSPVFSPELAYDREATLLWSNSYGLHDGASEFEETLDLMSSGQLDAEGMITHRFPLENIAEAFATANDKPKTHAIKVVVHS
jgi:2-desacetyl-2-hydroxyethyl bacteriochlorophyllide A dehydrogenase